MSAKITTLLKEMRLRNSLLKILDFTTIHRNKIEEIISVACLAENSTTVFKPLYMYYVPTSLKNAFLCTVV